MTAAIAAVLAPAAMAAEQKATEPKAAGPAIEEIVVTARYKAENLQDTPLTMSAFDESALAKITAQDLRDVGPSTPNMHIQPVVTFHNSAAVHIRGMGGQGIESTEENRVGIALNGVAISRPVATLFDLFDTEKVEILRGPQGTTFGKNSLAGGVAITTKKPTGDFDWQAEVTGGNYGREDYRGAVEFPILQDKLSMRISGIMQNFDGVYTNISQFRHGPKDLQGEDMNSGRATLRFTPNESWETLFIYSVLDENSTAPGGDVINNNAQGIPTRPPQIMCTFLGWCSDTNHPGFPSPPFAPPNKNPFKVTRDALDDANTRQDTYTLINNVDLGQFTLTSVTGRITTDDFIASDFDQTEVPFFPTFREQEHTQFSSELRLHSDFGARDDFWKNLDLVTGLYYFNQHHDIVQSFPTLGSPSSADYTHQTNDQKAVFGQVIYALNDRTNFSFGVRYTDEEKDFKRNPGILCGNPNIPNGCARILPYVKSSRPSIDFMASQPKTVVGDLNSNNTSVRVGADYRLMDNVLTYASYSQGYKAGEFGARAGSLATVGPTDDEESDNYEIGVKSDWLDGTLRVNVATFYTEYKNLVFGVFIPSPNNPTGQETANENVGQATNYGAEFEITWVPIENLTLDANVGLLHSEYDKFCADLDGPGPLATSNCGGKVTPLPNGTFLVDTDHTNLDLSRAPEKTYYLAAEYRLPTSIGAFSARISTSYEDTYFSDGLNYPQGETGDFWLWDSSLSWTSNDDAWRVQAWCKNCGDKEYTSGDTPTANFFTQHFYGDPMTYGLTLSYRS